MKCKVCKKEKEIFRKGFCKYCYNMEHEQEAAKKKRLKSAKEWARRNRGYFKEYYWRPEIHEKLKERYRLFSQKYRNEKKSSVHKIINGNKPNSSIKKIEGDGSHKLTN